MTVTVPCGSSAQRWNQVSERDLRSCLRDLDQAYREMEKEHPGGYSVVFGDSPQQGVILRGIGTRLSTQIQLVGVPDKREDCQQTCPFCRYVREGNKDERIINVFDQALAVQSMSGQVLVIPKEHYVHWFETPIDEQLRLLGHAFAIRDKSTNLGTMGLHCGTLAGQTVFHTHLRTGLSVLQVAA